MNNLFHIQSIAQKKNILLLSLPTKVISPNSPEGGFKLATLMHDTVTRLANLPLISVCLVRGRAIGGGAELTLSTDFRAFAPTGKLNFVQARLGVLPGWAGGSKLVTILLIVLKFVDTNQRIFVYSH